MERIIEREVLFNTVVPVLFVAVMVFAMATIAFGMESVARGVHDAFHDFRHVIGMPCH